MKRFADRHTKPERLSPAERMKDIERIDGYFDSIICLHKHRNTKRQEAIHFDIRSIINELPAADVQPVKRGEWEESENELNKFCSCCKKVCGTIYDTENYCPNCGADMRGGKPNE